MRATVKTDDQTALTAVLLLPVSDNKIGVYGSSMESVSKRIMNIQTIPSLKTHLRRSRHRHVDSTLKSSTYPEASTTYLIGFLVCLTMIGWFAVPFPSSVKPNGTAFEDCAVSRSTQDAILEYDDIMTVPEYGEPERPIEYAPIPGHYLEASTSDLIEMAAIVKTIALSSENLLKIKVKGLPLPGTAPLAETWGNLSFLRRLPGVSSRSTEKHRREILAVMRKHKFASGFGGDLPIWMDDNYIYSLNFNIVGDTPAFVEVLRGFPSPKHCASTNTCGTT